MQAFNPYLPSWEYIPDGEPHIFGNRVYVYGSHDEFNGESACLNDYVCWSAPTDAPENWEFHGTIFRKDQDPDYVPGKYLYAPDVTPGPDGAYYLYYGLSMDGTLSVARSETPTGPFSFYGKVCYSDGRILGQADDDVYQFDPAVLLDDDGRVWLYTGFGYCRDNKIQRFGNRIMDGAYCTELMPDMKTVKIPPVRILPKKTLAMGTDFEDHAFFEACSIRKIQGIYYLVYSSALSHELCYAVSSKPNGGFRFGGVIVSNCDVGMNFLPDGQLANHFGNNHGGMVKLQDQWYIFYHRQTNNHGNSRQGCAEPITMLPDGRIPQVEMTSCGLNGGPLEGTGEYPAGIACQLFSLEGDYPYITQEDGKQLITKLKTGSVAGFKYFDLSNTHRITLTCRGNSGTLRILDNIHGKVLSEIFFSGTSQWQTCSAPLSGGTIRSGLFITAETDGSIDLLSFSLSTAF